MRQARRWAIVGALLGAAVGAVVFAPASWLANAVAAGTDARVELAQARGTVWSGSAVLALTGGAGSRDAAALPGRLIWQLGWHDGAVTVGLQHACCLNGTQTLRVQPGLGQVRVALADHPNAPAAPGAGNAVNATAASTEIGHWPAAWLAGLGTPWNTLDLSGSLRLSANGLAVENVRGRWRMDGSLQLELADVASRISTLPVLGTYRVQIDGDADRGANLTLRTLSGALLLQGAGTLAPSGLRFRGDARAAAGSEPALDNLLNIIGRRQGALSLLSIG